MNDTSKNIHFKFIEKMKSVDGVERLKMASSMFDTSKVMVLASIGREMSSVERCKKSFFKILWQRLYSKTI